MELLQILVHAAVDDLRLLLSVLRGSAAGAPDSAACQARAAAVARLCAELGASVEPALVSRLDESCEALAVAGYEVVEAKIPGGARLPELFGELVGTELLAHGLPALGTEIGAETCGYLEAMFGSRRLPGIAELVAAQTEPASLASAVSTWMDQNPLVVAPVVGAEPPPLGFDRDLSASGAAQLFDLMRNAVWVNLLGLPGAALPNGIQVVGRRFAEAEVFDAAGSARPLLLAAQEAPWGRLLRDIRRYLNAWDQGPRRLLDCR